MHSRKLTVVLLLCLSIVFAEVSGKQSISRTPRTLILLDDLGVLETHSIFFEAVEGLGHEVVFSKADDPNLQISEHGEYLYDNLIIFAPRAERFGGKVDVPSIVEFMDSGRNVIVAVNPSISDAMRELATECGIEFDEQNTNVIDHLNYDESDSDGDHSVVVADQFTEASRAICGESATSKALLFSGISHTVKDTNDLVIPLSVGSATTYSHSPDAHIKGVPLAIGKHASLVSVLQARNDARAIFSGSLDMFSNKYFQMPIMKHGSNSIVQSGNKEFLTELLAWTFKAKGVIRAHSVNFRRAGEQDKPKIVTIKEEIEYSIVVEEMKGGKWVPYLADDIPLEFVMLDPYVRVFLQHKGDGLYSTKFILPDVYGIFKFRISYHRLGYSSIELEDTLPVRPFRHTEYERFISSAFPYYAASFSMVIGFIVFSVLFLYSK